MCKRRVDGGVEKDSTMCPPIWIIRQFLIGGHRTCFEKNLNGNLKKNSHVLSSMSDTQAFAIVVNCQLNIIFKSLLVG